MKRSRDWEEYSPPPDNPNCEKCRDTGLVAVDSENRWHSEHRECDCGAVEQIHAERWGPYSGLPARCLTGKGFADFIARNDADASLLATCKNYVETFTLESPGLIMVGPAGSGKSFAASRIARGVLYRRFKPKWWNVPDLLATIKGTFNSEARGGESEWDIIQEARNADLLVLDDVGADKASEFSLQELFLIINGRIEDGTPTIITTNLTESKWVAGVGERLASRFYEIAPRANRIAVVGEDRRRD